MSKKSTLNSFGAVVGTALAGSILTVPVANAGENPFQITELGNASYVVADAHKEGGCGEGKCGGKMEGKCGMGMKMKKMDEDGDGAISREEFMQYHEEKFTKIDADGDGKATEEEMKAMMKKMHEGKCGGKKSEG